MKKSRGYYMTKRDQVAMGYNPETDSCSEKRTHTNCKALTGVARPGKTARDRSRAGQAEL